MPVARKEVSLSKYEVSKVISNGRALHAFQCVGEIT
jgi:hypothetical protein